MDFWVSFGIILVILELPQTHLKPVSGIDTNNEFLSQIQKNPRLNFEIRDSRMQRHTFFSGILILWTEKKSNISKLLFMAFIEKQGAKNLSDLEAVVTSLETKYR